MSTYKVGVIGGDGIGPEVVAEALKVVRAAGVSLDTTEYDLGADRYVRTGEVLPDSVLEELRGHDAILLGAIGATGRLDRGAPGHARAGPAPPPPVRAGPLHQPAALHRGARRAGSPTATSS